MAKTIANYELMTVFNAKLDEDATKAIIEKFRALIEENGTIDNVNEWGKRRLAYTIDYETEGYYVLYTFSSAPDFPTELSRVLKITDGVVRSLITVVEEK